MAIPVLGIVVSDTGVGYSAHTCEVRAEYSTRYRYRLYIIPIIVIRIK